MIILVRHGEATHHTQHLTGGWTDSDLTEAGRGQLRALADKLAHDFNGKRDKFRILTSDLKRAVESAEIIAAKLGMADCVERHEFLREKNNGRAAGMTEAEAKEIYRPAATLKELNHRNYPGGETRKEFYDRCVKGIRACADMEKENLIIVAHKGTIQNIIFYWLGFDIEEVNNYNFSVDILPGSLTVLGVNKWLEHSIFLLNDTSHLHKGEGYGIFNYKYYKKY